MSRIQIFAALLVGTVCTTSAAYAESVKPLLGGYHFGASIRSLTQVAGSTQALVSELLVLRHDGVTPFVAIRAEKLLLQLSSETGVVAALTEDVRSPRFAGLARAVAIHVDDVPDASARLALAGEVLGRAGRDASFVPYARSLLQSRDPSVSAGARTALPAN